MDYDAFATFGEALKTFRQRKNITQQQLAAKLAVHRNTIGGWERGDYLPESRGMVLEIARHLHLDDQEARNLLEVSLTALAPYWSMPALRNPFFTGREEVLDQLHEGLCAEQALASLQAYALYGLGGIGKTQVAIEYAYRYALEYRAVFWLAAETAESLMASFQQIANQLQLAERQATEQSQIVTAVQRWLTAHSEWLLIADNVEDLDLVQTLLPAARQGSLLLTTRRRALGTLARPLELLPLNNEEGATLLLRRARFINIPDAPAASTEQLQRALLASSALSPATELVKLLEGLPLALDQAGAYIEETGCGVAEYLQRCHDQRKYILAHRGNHGGAHPASVTATVKLSVEQVEREQPAAADLLRLCAFLHPEAIPEELFPTGASSLGPVLGPVVANPYQFDLTLAALRNASLLTRYAETKMLSMHRLVHAVLRDQMEPVEERQWSERAVRMINATFPEPDYDKLAQCERCLAQALACVPLIKLIDGDLSDASELFSKAGVYLTWRGRFGEAESLFEQAVNLEEQQHGLDRPALILYRLNQAQLFWSRGKYEQTEVLLQRTLALAREYQGDDHLLTARTLNALGILYWKQGKYEQAEPLYLQALCIREQQLGPEHLDTAETLNDLALLYQEQRKYKEAEPFYERSLRVREQQLGPEHPSTAVSINNLANLYCDLRKHEQAEPLYWRSLRIREQQFGPEHPKTAIALRNLATLYRDWENYEEAEPLYQRALIITEQQLGPEHPEMALVLHSMAYLYHLQGRAEQAESFYQKALDIGERQLGSEHPRIRKMRADYSRFQHER